MAEEIGYKDRSAFYEYELVDTADFEFVHSLIEEVGLQKGLDILEIPSGTGRLSFEIAAEKCHVVAADVEPAMVERVKERIKIYPNGKYIQPVVADMCTHEFGKNFDLILVPREAFQLVIGIQQGLKALTNFKKHLKSNGMIMVDIFPFGRIVNAKSDDVLVPDYYDPQLEENKDKVDWIKDISNTVTLTRLHRQRQNDQGNTEIMYHFKKYDHKTEKLLVDSEMFIELQNYTIQSFEKICEEAGLEIMKIYGNYKRKVYTDHDPRMLFILKNR